MTWNARAHNQIRYFAVFALSDFILPAPQGAEDFTAINVAWHVLQKLKKCSDSSAWGHRSQQNTSSEIESYFWRLNIVQRINNYHLGIGARLTQVNTGRRKPRNPYQTTTSGVILGDRTLRVWLIICRWSMRSDMSECSWLSRKAAFLPVATHHMAAHRRHRPPVHGA